MSSFFTLSVVPNTLDKGDYGSVGSYSYALRLAVPAESSHVRRLVRETVAWLRTSKDTDQWREPWPDAAGHHERILNDLFKGKTWLAWDGSSAVATITVDTEEPLILTGQPLWPAHRRDEAALYVRRVIVSRRYAGQGLGAALLDWAADVARRDHGASLIRVDVWTTNTALHAYYERQGFTPCTDQDARDLADYPSQALFEREVNQSGSGFTRFFIENA